MIALKILLQIGIGITSLLTAYLDYKWYDRRKKYFKKGRNILFFLTVVILTASLFTTYQDERNQTYEKEKLTEKLNSLRDSLSVVKQIGMELNSQIEPILSLAKSKYPDLPREDALKKIEWDIENLKELETQRKNQEIAKNKLKNTAPNFNPILEIKDENLNLIILFKNEIPINFTYQLYNKQNEELPSFLWNSQMNAFPKKGIDGIRFFICKVNDLKKMLNISIDKNEEFVFEIIYESIYFSELGKKDLMGVKRKEYIINISKKYIEEKNNNNF